MGDIKNKAMPMREMQEPDSLDTIRLLLFTNGEVDIDKLLCLHLLTAHAVELDENQLIPDKPSIHLLLKAGTFI